MQNCDERESLFLVGFVDKKQTLPFSRQRMKIGTWKLKNEKKLKRKRRNGKKREEKERSKIERGGANNNNNKKESSNLEIGSKRILDLLGYVSL